MLPTSRRLPLRKSGDFFSTARRIHHQWFVCWYQPSSQQFQAAVTVGKRVSPKAVDRNALKRRMREILRTTAFQGKVKTVFVMKKAALGISAEELTIAVQKTLSAIPHENIHLSSD